MVHHPNKLPKWFKFISVQFINPTERYSGYVSVACLFMLILVCLWVYFYIGGQQTPLSQDAKLFTNMIADLFYAMVSSFVFHTYRLHRKVGLIGPTCVVVLPCEPFVGAL